MKTELRDRLMDLHQEKLEVALMNKDTPLSLDLQEIFERDKTFRDFMVACSMFFDDRLSQGKGDDVAKVLLKMVELMGGKL